MSLVKLAPTELRSSHGPSAAVTEYASFLRTLKIGEGGRAVVADEGATRITVKNRISQAADIAGVAIAFRPTPPEELVFELVQTAPKRRGRPPKNGQ